MKKGIHPNYFADATFTCKSCNTEYKFGSVLESGQTEICSKCHPFFTGENKTIDLTGRVDKFNKKYAQFFNVKDKK